MKILEVTSTEPSKSAKTDEYLVSYDFTEQEYLVAANDTLSKKYSATRILKSVWLLKRNGTDSEKLCQQIRRQIEAQAKCGSFDSADRLGVFRISDGAIFNPINSVSHFNFVNEIY